MRCGLPRRSESPGRAEDEAEWRLGPAWLSAALDAGKPGVVVHEAPRGTLGVKLPFAGSGQDRIPQHSGQTTPTQSQRQVLPLKHSASSLPPIQYLKYPR